MKNQDQSVFSPELLIELEKTCDLFEQELKQGDSPDVEKVVGNATPELRRVLRQEIGLLLDEYKLQGNDETVNPQGYTLTPSDLATPRKRSDSFESQSGDEGELNSELEVSEPRAGASFGRFQLHSVVGRGGSGTVWRAYDGNLDRWVALKISHPRSSLDAKRFVREAQAVSQLKHPNIIPVFEAGELSGKCFLVSEFCDGQSLSRLMKDGPIASERAVEIALAIVNAITHSHQMGIVHRDIKPHNVMINFEGCPMVTDFGLARNLRLDQTITREGELIGTPGYMAPEQAKGGGVACDERTDIYSIGVVLYQLLSGRLPFSGSFERVIFQVINSVPPSLRSIDKSIPVELAAICAKCLEKSPERRFQSVVELGDELRRFVAGKPVATRNVSWAGRYLRWLQREPVVAWLTTVCALLLLMTTIGSTWAAYSLANAWRNEKAHLSETKRSLADAIDARKKESLARERAESAETLANKKTQETEMLATASRQEADFLTTLLAPVDIIGVSQMHSGSTKGTHLLSPETIESATVQVNQLVDAPLVQARVKSMLANAWRSLGQFEQAKSLLMEATELLERSSDYGEEPMLCDRAMNQLYWAYWHHHNEDYVAAEECYRRAIEIHQKSVEESGQSITCLLHLAQAEFGLGALLLRKRQNDQAEPYLHRALTTRRKYLTKGDSLLMATELTYLQCKPNTTFVDIAEVLESLDQDVVKRGLVLYWEIEGLRKKKSYPKAVRLYQELVQLISDSLGTENSLYVLAIGDFASLQWRAGNYREAYVMIEEAIEKGGEMSRWHPARMRAMNHFGYELHLAHRFDEAKELLAEITQHRLPKFNNSIRLNLDLAWCLYRTDDYEQALAHSQQPLTNIGNCTAAETAWYCFTHATMLAAVGDKEEAEEFHQRAVETVEKMIQHSKLPEHSTWLQRSGMVMTHHGLDESAEMLFRRSIEFATLEYFETHPRVAGIKCMLAENLIRQGKLSEGEELLEQVLDVYQDSLPADDQRIKLTLGLLERLSKDDETD